MNYQKKRNRNKGSNFFSKYILSCLILLALPLLVLSYNLYTSQIVQYKINLDEKYIYSIDQVKNKFDYVVNELFINSLSIGSQYDVDQLILEESTDYETSKNIIQFTEQSLYPSPSIFLYSNSYPYYLTSGGKVKYFQYEDNMDDIYDMEIRNFYPKIYSCMNRYIFSSNEITQESQTELIYFLYPLPYPSYSPSGAIAFSYTNSQVNEIFESFIGEISGNILIYDENDELIYLNSINDAEIIQNPSTIDEIIEIKGTGIHQHSDDATDYVISKNLSEETGLTYCFVMIENVAYQNMTQQTTHFVLVLLVICLITVLLALVFAFYNYLPIKKMVKIVGPKNFTDTALGKIFDEYGDLKIQSQKNSPIIIDRCIEYILFSDKSSVDLNYYIQCAGIRFKHEEFFVIVVSFEKDFYYYQQAKDMIVNLSFDLVTSYPVELYSENSMVAVLVNCDKKAIPKDFQKQYCEKIFELMNENLDQKVTIGIGLCCDDLENCKTSFLQAKTALEITTQKDKCVFYEDHVSTYLQEEYPVIEYTILSQSIRYGNLNASISALDEIFEKVENNISSMLIMHYFFSEMVGYLLKLASKLNISIDTQLIRHKSTEFKGLAEYKDYMVLIVTTLCESVLDEKNTSYIETKQNIIKFILANYNKNEISINYVSDEFNIYGSYLNKVVTEETGMKFNAYITMLRMEKAKILLKETDMKVKDIVSELGYVDVANFIRKFKLSENMTPGQYRKMHSI